MLLVGYGVIEKKRTYVVLYLWDSSSRDDASQRITAIFSLQTTASFETGACSIPNPLPLDACEENEVIEEDELLSDL